jgi:hypothetical protein
MSHESFTVCLASVAATVYSPRRKAALFSSNRHNNIRLTKHQEGHEEKDISINYLFFDHHYDERHIISITNKSILVGKRQWFCCVDAFFANNQE